VQVAKVHAEGTEAGNEVAGQDSEGARKTSQVLRQASRIVCHWQKTKRQKTERQRASS
jgi:hypothetical protein